jgi:hypothetical protein
LFCVNNICCADECNVDEHCDGTGNCVEGTLPTATPTATPTPSSNSGASPTRTRTPLPGNCASSCKPEDCQPDGSCFSTDRSGGCSTGEPTADGRDALMLSLLPIGLWLVRRRQLRQVAARVRIRS